MISQAEALKLTAYSRFHTSHHDGVDLVGHSTTLTRVSNLAQFVFVELCTCVAVVLLIALAEGFL